MSCIQIDHILLTTGVGAHVVPALREAVALAFTENRDVVLRFNDAEYTVDVHVIIDSIITGKKLI